ncbi:hypothetical protein [Streptomyces sp. CAU 1734]|uniref:hypothetical protein n=1 Tax=Streptomyces sp. CAU 1734 TaxID=3140360 RepID=UPI0032602187
MSHAFDLSATEHAWSAARDAHRISTAALLREALPTLGLSGGEDNPYGVLRCTLPAGPDAVTSEVRVAVTGEGADLVIKGVPVAVMRQVLVTNASIFFSPFTAETSLGRTLRWGRLSRRAHGAEQHLTVPAGASADATLTLSMVVAARSLRAVAHHVRSASGQ